MIKSAISNLKEILMKLLKKTALIFSIFLLFFIVLPCGSVPDETSVQKVYVIPVAGDVDPGMSAFVKRALENIPVGNDTHIIFEMSTFGGRVDSALQIVDTIVNNKKGKTIAYVKDKAISAGALIALSCDELTMNNNTTIGDCAPITYSKEGPKMMGEKFQSPLRAKFRSLAKKNGYPEKLAEAMVTAEMEVYRIEMEGKTYYMDSREYKDLGKKEKDSITSKKTTVAKGELLTMDDLEAKELGFSRMSVSGLDELLVKMKVGKYEIVRIETSWSEIFVSFIGKISPILMLIGLAALYTEIKAPGFGAPGAVGIICLSLVFLSQYIVGMADYTELLIIVLGIILLGFELFVIPGFGIAGIAGVACLAVGMILSLQDFVIPDPSLPWEFDLLINNIAQVLGSSVLAFIISLSILRFVIPKLSRVVDGPYLEVSLEDSHADSIEANAAHIGDTGLAMTPLRPSGKARMGDEIFDVITEGEFLEKGTPIIISEIRGNRVIVSKK